MSEVHFYRPEAPESIWIDRGPNGGWMFRTEKLHDSVRQYVPADTIEAQLKTVLDREAETHRRHDAKVEAQAAEMIEQARIIGMGAERELALRAEIKRLRGVLDALLQHDASSFFGADREKNQRASYRGVIRKAKKARAALGEME